MPLLPVSLAALLASPNLLPPHSRRSQAPDAFPSPSINFPTTDDDMWFEILAKSLSFQITLALEYIHGLSSPVAHRDIKPGNVLIDDTGCVKIIDFGIAWDTGEMAAASAAEPARSPYEIPEETASSMISQVGSGTYRAIELLFSPPIYDPCATDLWSLGVTLGMFYTDIRWVPTYVGDDESNEDDDDLPSSEPMHWSRRSLFKASRGEIGLIWSIFRLLGTPTETTWPDFRSLPGARMMSFNFTPPADLGSYLVNLPSPSSSAPSLANPLDLIQRLLVLDPARRLSASKAIRHPWFSDGAPLVLPPQLTSFVKGDHCHCQVSEEWNGYNLRDILSPGVKQAYSAFHAVL